MYKKEYREFKITGAYKALVVDVYDGDTITVVFDPFPNSQYSDDYWFKLRLSGIDTPEMKISKENPYRDQLKELAIKARDLLRSRILNQNVMVIIFDTDKFGRLLGDVYCEKNESTLEIEGGSESVNDWMVQQGVAVAYDGGAKYDWELQLT